MIKKTVLAAVTALSLVSVSAPAAEPDPNKVLQDCFSILSAAQLKIWERIAAATLESCHLFEKYSGRDDEQGFFDAISMLSDSLLADILRIQDDANAQFDNRYCWYYHRAYSEVEFDTRGFEPYYGFPFTYAFLCGAFVNGDNQD